MNILKQSTLPENCRHDLIGLHNRFYRQLDHSKVNQSVNRILSDPLAWEDQLIGEGADCRAYLLTADQLVLTVPKNTFTNRTLAHTWGKHLQVIKDIGVQPLLPPLHTILMDHNLILITPFGNESVENTATHWQPLSKWVTYTQSRLRQSGLFINDSIQIRCSGGVPFIVDFSDLQPLS